MQIYDAKTAIDPYPFANPDRKAGLMQSPLKSISRLDDHAEFRAHSSVYTGNISNRFSNTMLKCVLCNVGQ